MALVSYKTLMERAEDEFIVNKSRFIGHGKPVESEEEALSFLREMRETYKDASHNCYAYIIGANMGVMHPTARYLMDVPYPLLSRVEYFFKSAPVSIESKDFSDVITFTFLVKVEDEPALIDSLTQRSEGKLEPMRFEEIYSAWREE